MRRLEWSDRARTRFDSIFDYVAGRDFRAAVYIAERLEATAEALSRRPIGRPGPGRTYVKRVIGTRYLLVYALGPGDAGAVRILEVFHSSQDWTKLLSEPS